MRFSGDLTLKNTSYISHTKRNTLSTYYYTEIIDPSWFAENRSEFIFNTKSLSANAGLDLRYQRTKAYDDYFFEPANVWDITRDHAYINVYNAPAFAANNGFPVPGWPNRFAQPGLFNGDTNDSHGTTVGPFVQTTWRASESLNVVTGLRYDYFKAHVREPLLRNRDELGVRPVRRQRVAEHRVPRTERGHPAADGLDHARDVQPERERRLPEPPHGTRTDLPVRRVHPGRRDPDQDLARPRVRPRDLRDLQDLRAAPRPLPHCTHLRHPFRGHPTALRPCWTGQVSIVKKAPV